MKKSYISFYVVLGLFLILTIVIFIIMLHVNSLITSQMNEQISLFVASVDIRNINSLLSSKIDYYDLNLPFIDLLMVSSFFDTGTFRIYRILEFVKADYKSRYNIEFGYCTKTGCVSPCKALYSFPTAYGDLVICSPEFGITFGHGLECGESV